MHGMGYLCPEFDDFVKLLAVENIFYRKRKNYHSQAEKYIGGQEFLLSRNKKIQVLT